MKSRALSPQDTAAIREAEAAIRVKKSGVGLMNKKVSKPSRESHSGAEQGDDGRRLCFIQRNQSRMRAKSRR